MAAAQCTSQPYVGAAVSTRIAYLHRSSTIASCYVIQNLHPVPACHMRTCMIRANWLHSSRHGALSTVGRTFQWDDHVPKSCRTTVLLIIVIWTWLCSTGDIEQSVLCHNMRTNP